MWLLNVLSRPHLLRHVPRTMLTVLGISLGVAAMVATTSVTDAAFRAFRSGIEATAGRAQLHLSNGTAGVPEELVGESLAVPGVAGAAPLVEGFVPLAGRDGELLAIFGIDLVADQEHEAQLPRAAVDIPDEVLFLSRPDSIAVARPLMAAHGWAIDSHVDVVTPGGLRTLVIRGLVDAVGPASLFGGMVALMDIPAAERLLGREGKVDRIDIRFREGAAPADVKRALAECAHGAAEVEETTVHGARAEDLLFSVRVMLGIAALVAVVVGFFIIYHTVSVSVVQRRREIGLLSALGVSRQTLFVGLAGEAALLGGVAGVIGYGIGFALARIALLGFDAVVTAFARLPAPVVSVSGSMLVLAAAVGVGTTVSATLWPTWSVLAIPTAQLVHLAPHGRRRHPWHAPVVAFLGLVIATVILAFAPHTLPYAPLVGFIWSVNCLVLVSFALLCPAATLTVGRIATHAAERTRSLPVLLAGSAVARDPGAPAAVVTAIVLGLGWTLADASLIDSFRASWLGWLDHHYRSDLIVSGGAATVSFLTAPPFGEAVLDEIRAIPGVLAVQGLRIVDVDHAGHAIAIEAIDPETATLPLIDGSWEAVAAAFRAGQGVAVSHQLAHVKGLGRGDTLNVPTPSGSKTFPILGVFTDFRVGTMGAIAMSRAAYRSTWKDPLVNTAYVWIVPRTDLPSVRAAIQQRFGSSHGLRALTAGDFRAAVEELTIQIFALHYTIVLIALLVSVIGVTNFLLSAVLDRRAQLRTLDAIGTSSAQIAGAVVAEGAMLGTIGAAIGLVAGAIVSRIIVEHSVPMVDGWHFEFRFPLGTAVELSLASVVLAAVAGILPARLAIRRRLMPQEVDE